MKKWKNFKSIINGYSILIYKRDGFEVQNTFVGNIKIIEAPLIEISATKIRELIKAGKSIRYLVPEIVREEIENRQFYKKDS